MTRTRNRDSRSTLKLERLIGHSSPWTLRATASTSQLCYKCVQNRTHDFVLSEMRILEFIHEMVIKFRLIGDVDWASSQSISDMDHFISIEGAEWFPPDLTRLPCPFSCALLSVSFLQSIRASDFSGCRQSRLSKALHIICENEEGILWVKLLHAKSASLSHPHSRGTQLIPIRWVKASNKRPKMQQIAAVPPISPSHDSRCDTLLRLPASDELSDSGPPDKRKGERAKITTSDVADPPPAAVGSHDTTRRSKEREDDENVCVVCMERAADFQLLPCRHDRFCRQCIVETICTWVRPEAPCCPLCRGAFHTMVLLDGTD